MINLLKDTKITRVLNAVSAGTSTQTSSVIDMQGFDSVAFVACIGDIADGSALELVAQHGDESNLSDAADVTTATVTHTATTASADNKVMAVEVMRPIKRYLRAKLVRGTANAIIDSIVAIQANPMVAPTTHDTTTVLGTAFALSPASE